MNQPPIYLLQTLAVFHETGTVAKAAALLAATQPTVTRQLQQLEEWSRTPLFEPRGRKKVLTEYGRELAEAFQTRFRDFALDVQRSQKRYARPSERELRVCAGAESLSEFFSALEFVGHLELVALDAEEIVRELAKQTADVAVLATQAETDDYVVRRLFTTRLQLLMPKRWSREVPSFRELAKLCVKYPLCTRERGPASAGRLGVNYEDLQDLLVETLGLVNRPEPRASANDWQTIEARVHGQQAWALVPSNFAGDSRGYWRVELPASFGQEPHFLYVRRSIAKQQWLRDVLASVMA